MQRLLRPPSARRLTRISDSQAFLTAIRPSSFSQQGQYVRPPKDLELTPYTPIHSIKTAMDTLQPKGKEEVVGCCPELCCLLLLFIGEKVKGQKGPARRRLRMQNPGSLRALGKVITFHFRLYQSHRPGPRQRKIGNNGEMKVRGSSQSAVKPVPFEIHPRQRLVRSYGSHGPHRSREAPLPKYPKGLLVWIPCGSQTD